jgi:hypothetical protein
VVGVFWLLSGLGSALISAAWRDAQDDDDDEWLDWEHWSPVDLAAQTFFGPLGGIPLLNSFGSVLAGFSNGGPFQAVARGRADVQKLLEGDKTEPVEKTVDRATVVLNAAGMLSSKVEGIAIGANIFKQAFKFVDNFTPDTDAEGRAKLRRRILRERKAAREQ